MEKFKIELKNYLNINENEKKSKEIVNIFLAGYPYEDYSLSNNFVDFINDRMHHLDDLIIADKAISLELNKILKEAIQMIEESESKSN